MTHESSMIRFLHSADLHLGKPFGAMPEELRGRLREARHTVLDRLASQTRKGGAALVLLAGDMFDSSTPTLAVLRQAMAAMGGHDDLRWVILPGNHDSLAADQLWSTAAHSRPANVTLATTAAPLALADNVMLLPAPCTTRRPGRDLSEWMDSVSSPDGTIRIGLAHGPVQTFSEDGVTDAVIAPDRATRAGLDYLALGDWHGQTAIGPRTWYSGTPEPDRFKHNVPGRALMVSIAAAGAIPVVEAVETGLFDWRMVQLSLLPGDEAESELARLLPPGPARRHALLRIAASGRTRPQVTAALSAAVSATAPEFALLHLNVSALASEFQSDDLDLIDRAGALRHAADSLLAESHDEARSVGERDIAREALIRLFSYCAAMPS